jgi:hypothetical protein
MPTSLSEYVTHFHKAHGTLVLINFMNMAYICTLVQSTSTSGCVGAPNITDLCIRIL